jgi:hypothetical protein
MYYDPRTLRMQARRQAKWEAEFAGKADVKIGLVGKLELIWKGLTAALLSIRRHHLSHSPSNQSHHRQIDHHCADIRAERNGGKGVYARGGGEQVAKRDKTAGRKYAEGDTLSAI